MEVRKEFDADLSAYSETVLDVSDSAWAFFKRHPAYTKKLALLTLFLELVLAYVGFSFLSFQELLLSDNAELVFLALLSPLIVPGIVYWRVDRRMRHLFFTQLAQSLGMTYVPSAQRDTVAGHFFSIGSGGKPTNVLSGTYKNAPIRLFEYTFTTGSGKHKQTHNYLVSEIDTRNPLPHIFMRPDNSFSFGRPSGTKLLSLEGNFNDYFDVYVQEDGEIETLQILEPDIMVKLIDEFPHFGFECSGTKTYVFHRGSFSDNRESLLTQLKFVDKLHDEFIPELQGVARSSTV